jgi:predicted alpha-1,2-mannosidase
MFGNRQPGSFPRHANAAWLNSLLGNQGIFQDTFRCGAHASAAQRAKPAGTSKSRAHHLCVLLATVWLGQFSLAARRGVAQAPAQAQPAREVDPLIGTGEGPPPTVNLSNENTFPGATMPFGMVQLSPDTESKGYGYHYDQDTIQGFSMTHMSGVGCPVAGDIFFTPTTGQVSPLPAAFSSPYSHRDEAASPGLYRVRLSRWNIGVQLTATDRTGTAQFVFPAGTPANILIPISHTLNHTAGAYIRVLNDHQIEGFVVNGVICGKPQTYKVYFAMTFSRPFAAFGTWNGMSSESATLAPGRREESQITDGQWVGAYATWSADAHPQTVTATIGISYVDLAGAENNLRAETKGKTFSELSHRAASAWNRELSVIEIHGGTARDRRIFYTALYHSMMMPNLFSDDDGRYVGFDDQVRHVASGHRIYANYSGWDVYRSEMPLLALIEPQRMQDMAQSIVLMYKQGGWIDRWPQANRYTNIMIGSPLTTVLSVAWLDGLHDFDIQSAWEGMLLDATQSPPEGKPYIGEAGIQWINQIHYVPNDKVDYGSVSQIQEDCMAYASLYRLAVSLGKTDEAKMLYQRALYYRNVFDPDDRFFRARNLDGTWVEPFDPSVKLHGFVEGSAWHYQWLAPWDMAWLVHAVGPELFNQRLSAFFRYKEVGQSLRYYNAYDETDLEAPFEFNFSGRPWESQHAVRRILAENYADKPDGIPGNDDAGAMSSWAVLSMMGIYSVDPASLAYELVSPLFPQIVVHLQPPYPGKEFTIETGADPESTDYIQRVQLNGHAYTRNWISFRDIRSGSTLHVSLGREPNRSWGASSQDAPPSLSDGLP